FAPHPDGILRPIGDAVGARAQAAGGAPLGVARAHALKVAHVEAGTKGAALARDDDGAHTALALQALAGLDERAEHGVIERVHLVGAHQANVGDAALDGDCDAIVHAAAPSLAFNHAVALTIASRPSESIGAKMCQTCGMCGQISSFTST